MSSSKRHFTVVMNSKEHGLYVSSTPSSAARKVVSKLCADNKNKKVEFSLRETTQRSNKKIYGPYLGYMQKLDKPVELEGRVIRYKSIVKLKKSLKKNNQIGGSLKVGDLVKVKDEFKSKIPFKNKMLPNKYIVININHYRSPIITASVTIVNVNVNLNNKKNIHNNAFSVYIHYVEKIEVVQVATSADAAAAAVENANI